MARKHKPDTNRTEKAQIRAADGFKLVFVPAEYGGPVWVQALKYESEENVVAAWYERELELAAEPEPVGDYWSDTEV